AATVERVVAADRGVDDAKGIEIDHDGRAAEGAPRGIAADRGIVDPDWSRRENATTTRGVAGTGVTGDVAGHEARIYRERPPMHPHASALARTIVPDHATVQRHVAEGCRDAAAGGVGIWRSVFTEP